MSNSTFATCDAYVHVEAYPMSSQDNTCAFDVTNDHEEVCRTASQEWVTQDWAARCEEPYIGEEDVHRTATQEWVTQGWETPSEEPLSTVDVPIMETIWVREWNEDLQIFVNYSVEVKVGTKYSQ